MKQLNKSQKIIAGTTVALIIVGGMWFYMKSANAPTNTEQNSNSPENSLDKESSDQNASNNQNETAGTKQNNSRTSEDTANVTSPKDTSDTAIDKDLSSIDNQINNLNADSTNIDKGLSDQPIEQGQ